MSHSGIRRPESSGVKSQPRCSRLEWKNKSKNKRTQLSVICCAVERRSPGHVQRTDEVSATELAAPPAVLYGLLFMCMSGLHVTFRLALPQLVCCLTWRLNVVKNNSQRCGFRVSIKGFLKASVLFRTLFEDKRWNCLNFQTQKHFYISATKIRTIFCHPAQF